MAGFRVPASEKRRRRKGVKKSVSDLRKGRDGRKGEGERGSRATTELTPMRAQLQQVPQRLLSQRRSLDDQIPQRFESNSPSGSIRIGAESLESREKFERDVGEVEDETTEVGSGETRKVEVDKEEQGGSVER